MHNAASPAAPRPRTAAGATPPTIADDVARVAALCHTLAEQFTCCEGFTAADIASVAVPALERGPERRTCDVVIAAVLGEARTHLMRHGREQVPERWVVALEETLRESWSLTVAAGGGLEDIVAAIVAGGLDGELLTWSVIVRESQRHEGLINKECNKLARIFPDRTADELKGYGWQGLRVALRNFDPRLGFAFSTYACPKINGAIRDGVRAENPIPKRLTTFVRKITAAEEKLTQSLSRPPTYAEIAEHLDEDLEYMRRLLPRLHPSASIEELSSPWGEKSREPACLVDVADPEADALTALRSEAVQEAIATLPAEEAQAVRLLMLEEMPLAEAAALVGVEPRQLRARKKRALTALRPLLLDWAADPVAA